MIRADDMDVAILGLRFIPEISAFNSVLYMKSGTKDRIKYISFTDLHQNLDKSLRNALIGLHGLSGCDSISCFFGKRKKKSLA